MIQDPTDQYIGTILSQCELCGRDVLEIGCGKGRITRDLAKNARRVLASDPDSAALEIARSSVTADNVEFIAAPAGIPDLPCESFDVVIYTLSLHHVPVAEMSVSLHKAASLLRKDGVIVVVEPGDGGSFTEAKERFGAGSGDERLARKAAIQAMESSDGWLLGETIYFSTLFQLDSEEDFFSSMLPGCRKQPDSFVKDVQDFLARYRTGDGIILDAGRRLNVLRRI